MLSNRIALLPNLLRRLLQTCQRTVFLGFGIILTVSYQCSQIGPHRCSISRSRTFWAGTESPKFRCRPFLESVQPRLDSRSVCRQGQPQTLGATHCRVRGRPNRQPQLVALLCRHSLVFHLQGEPSLQIKRCNIKRHRWKGLPNNFKNSFRVFPAATTKQKRCLIFLCLFIDNS